MKHRESLIDKATAQQYAVKLLLEEIKPGDSIYLLVHPTNKMGTARTINVLIRGEEAGLFGISNISYKVATAIGEKIDEKLGGVRVSGCGMDMGAWLVMSLGRALWPNGTDKPHGTRHGKPDSSGLTALRGVRL